jgi:biotin carboxyl carrier protein
MSMGAPRVVRVAGRQFVVAFVRRGSEVVAELEEADGTRRRLRLEAGRAGRLLLDGRPLEYALLRRDRKTFVLSAHGEEWPVEVLSAGEAALGPGAGEAAGRRTGSLVVRAPMPGRVLAVEVAEGDLVDAGTGLFVVEAMKMENEIRSPRAGRVARVAIKEGEPVELDQPLCELLVGPAGDGGGPAGGRS